MTFDSWIEAIRAEPVPGLEDTPTVAPGNVDDLSRLLRHCSERRVPVRVWGGGSYQTFGGIAECGLVIRMDHFSGIEAWEPDDLTIVVGAGTRIGELSTMLAERHQTAGLPEDPSGVATVGGAVATARSPLTRLKLGGLRERMLEVTVVTGDGRVVRGGGRVVKNVSGFDLPRLVVGSFGALGVVVSACLRLWPVGEAACTIELPQALPASMAPLAVLSDGSRTTAYFTGPQAEIDSIMSVFGGTPGLDWLAVPSGDFGWSIRVPPADVSLVVSRIPDAWSHLALHGVGEIRAASSDDAEAGEVRVLAESLGGRLVMTAHPEGSGGFDPWGEPPPAIGLQQRLIRAFDPMRIINPGRLPGGL